MTPAKPDELYDTLRRLMPSLPARTPDMLDVLLILKHDQARVVVSYVPLDPPPAPGALELDERSRVYDVVEVNRPLIDVFADELLIDPDCASGKHLSCVGGPCECECHGEDE